MTDYVRGALGRCLGISESRIALWRLTCGVGSVSDSRFGAYNTPRRFEAEIEIQINADVEIERKLRERVLASSYHGLVLTQAQPYELAGTRQLSLTIRAIYGKDTQHLFKALAKMTVYRGPHKGKRK